MAAVFWTQEQDIGPASRAGHALAYDSTGQRVILFGGDPGGPPLDDTWAWDGNLWTQVADMGPSARHGATLVDEPARQRLLLFGGGAGADVLDDTWVFGAGGWTQVADTGPAARVNHAMAYDPNRQRAVLFGGQAAGLFGDTWEWDGIQWTQVEDVGPLARAGHAMAFDQATSRIVLFGGWNIGNSFNDTWAWNGTTWTQLADTGPDSRAEAAMVGAGGGLLLFGGVNTVDPAVAPADRVVYGDTWQLAGDTWTKSQDIGPSARYGHTLAYRQQAGRVTLFGGATAFAPSQDPALAGGLQRDTWEVPVASVQPNPGGVLNPGGVSNPTTGVTVTNIGVQPNVASASGDTLGVYVFLSLPAPSPMVLNVAIYREVGGAFQTVNPPGFIFQGPLVPAGSQSINFQMVRDGSPLSPGQYVVGVGFGAGVEATGSFQVM